MPYFPPYLGLNLDFEEEDDKIREFIQSSRSKETTRKIEFWLTRLTEHGKTIGINEGLTNLSKNKWNSLLCSFLIEAKRDNGQNYETSTLHSFFSLVGRYMKDNKIGNLDSDQEFQGARDVKGAKLKVIKSDGKGNRPNRTTSLSEEEEMLLFEKGQLGWETPEALQRTIWWLTTILFGHRGRDEARQLRWGDIILKEEGGVKFLEFVERQTKTRDGGETSGTRAFPPKAFENTEDPQRCPVRTYMEFAKRRPDAMKTPDSPFYLAVNSNRKADADIWYKCAPLGKNSIAGFLKTACIAAGIPGRKTNHSARKTCVKRALDAGCPREYVAQLTGHKSVLSLNNYMEADIRVQKAMGASVLTGSKFSVSSTSDHTAPPVTINISGCQNVTVVHNH